MSRRTKAARCPRGRDRRPNAYRVDSLGPCHARLTVLGSRGWVAEYRCHESPPIVMSENRCIYQGLEWGNVLGLRLVHTHGLSLADVIRREARGISDRARRLGGTFAEHCPVPPSLVRSVRRAGRPR